MTAIPPLAAVAHELRTPLGGILGCAELLAATPLDAEQRAHLAALREAAAALAAFAEDALALARLGAAAPHAAVRPRACDVRGVLAGVARTLAPAAAARGVAVEIGVAGDVPERVCADPDALRRVLLNLGANAVRASARASGARRVCLTAVADCDAGTLACAVCDAGPGMTAGRRAALFRAWESGWADAEAGGGAGLGLVLAAELAARMGGRLDVESVPGEGSTFTVTVPVGAVV